MKLELSSIIQSDSEEAVSEAPSMMRPQRWDSPFGDGMTDAVVDQVLSYEPFSKIDQTKFPGSMSLRDILKNDARVVKYHPGDIVVREGDYGSSAFFVLEGSVMVCLDIPSDLLGRAEHSKRSFRDVISQLWSNAKVAEKRDLQAYSKKSPLGERDSSSGDHRVFLQDFPTILGKTRKAPLQKGVWFGEIAALGRTPRTATVIADSDATLLEIRWQGLREIRLRAEEIKKHIDQLYRERSLASHFREMELFSHLPEEVINQIASQTIFETFGDFEWFGSYQALAKESAAKRLESEPLIVREGDYANGLILIRSGFARVSQRVGNGHRTLSYLGKGQYFGLNEIAKNWNAQDSVPFQHSLRAIGYVDVLIIPTSVIEKHLLPTLKGKSVVTFETDSSDKKALKQSGEVPSDILEFLVEHRYINGTATMMIDMERCTRCDDCVRACSSAHDNNPRFVRQGHVEGRFMVANACMHCVDPVCMIGCPTGAIHRSSAEGNVIINDNTCIGCSTCANSCPYDNIRMVEIRDEKGHIVRDARSNVPIIKATKCDLCIDQWTGPACQNACPHDALRRVDMQTLPTIANWFQS